MKGGGGMTQLAQVNRTIDALREQVGALDTEKVEEATADIGSAIENLAGIIEELIRVQARIYRQRAICGKWDLKKLEKEYILDVMAGCAGNQVHAAKRLGIARGTLWRKLKEFSADEG